MTPIDSLRSAPGLQPGLVRVDADLRLLNDDGTPSTELSARVHPAARSRLAAYLQAQREQPQAEAWLLGLPLNVEPEQMAWVDVRLHWQAEASGGAGSGVWHGECRDATQALLDQRLAALGLSVLDLMPSAAVITEARADRPIVYANPAFVALTGYAREEILGRSCAFLQGQEREQPALPALRRALAQGEAFEGVLHNFRKNGQPFWNHLRITALRDPETGWVTHFWSVQTDVTEKRERIAALSVLSLELESLFQDTPVGLVSFDRQGRANLVNAATAHLTGLALQGLDRMQVIAALAPWRLNDEADSIFTGASGGVCHIRVPGGRPRILELSTGTHGSSGTFDILVIRDVTAERTVSQMKTQFLSSAAHELRAPLASIQGFSELMQMRGGLSEDQASMMETIQRQSKRMTALLNDLLDLTRIEAQLPGQMDLREVDLLAVAQCAVDDQAVLSERHPLLLQAELRDWLVQADEVKLEQVLVNLLSNARKYSPQGGTIELSLLRRPERGQLGLAVRDHGMGMSPDTLSKLFTRFFRAHPNGEVGGTGLGLCIVQELVERMQGCIEVQSELGQGSVFTVWLPAAHQAPVQSE
ncbi:MAG: hypothetical protein CFE41_11055 [Burkholderiales bacterium PBB2]|nr:MAG: hypothetical protein CFE41_11055 [Burkholderiales bacterium PBB2]